MKNLRTVIAVIMAIASVTVSYAQRTDSAGVPYVTLNNGVEMPLFGLGTYNVPGDETAADAVAFAIRNGYRHFDTAHAYRVERGVGKGVKSVTSVPREDIWITSKLWPSEYGEGKTLEAIDKMLARLGVDYIDLLYVHQPVGDWRGAWRDMEKAVEQGKVRALGLSNFDAADSIYTAALEWARIKPAVMQIECHPYAQRTEWAERLKKDGIQLECWFPLGGEMSNGALFRDPAIIRIAEAHGKTPAQIILRWHIQEGHSTIPGAIDHGYITENISIFDFELTPEEMEQMRSLNKERRFFNMSYEQMQGFITGWRMDD